VVDVSELANRVCINLGITKIDADNFFYDPENDQIWCDKTLYELGTSGTLRYIMTMMGTEEALWIGDEVSLRRGEPLWKKSKPLSIYKAVVTPEHVKLIVEGMKTERVKEKWERVFSEKLQGVPVELEWKTVYENYQVVESGG